MTSIADHGPAWTGWALDQATARELAAWLDHARPATILEAGSGASTVLLAEYAARTGATVVSLEHSPVHAARTEQLLREWGLADRVHLRPAPIVATDTGPWYAAQICDPIDFALIDGPPGTIGRNAALPHLYPHLRGDWRVWVDDADRPGEHAAVTDWARRLPVYVKHHDLPKGLAVIRAGVPDMMAVPDLRPVDASDVCVTIVTGRRPQLLAATLDALQRNTPGLLESAYVSVLHNGGDPDTQHVLDGCDFINYRVMSADLMPVGVAAHAMLSTPPPGRFSLHLEDDWLACTTVPGWLDRARHVLDTDPQIGQVRLRHTGDRVMAKHMITRRPIGWTDGPAGHLVGVAHYTLNPSLMRSEDTPKIWDAQNSEQGAQIAFTGTGWKTAQAVPGVFRHAGDGQSLRLGQVVR